MAFWGGSCFLFMVVDIFAVQACLASFCIQPADTPSLPPLLPLPNPDPVPTGPPKPTKPQRNPDGSCFFVVANATFGTCQAIGAPWGITPRELNDWNKNTWKWPTCEGPLPIQASAKICVSDGTAPPPDVDPNAECGLTSAAQAKCPLNACCSKFGYCGTSADFCTVVSGAPGLGCQSNCGTDPPTPVCDASVMSVKVGFYESWASSRPAGCPSVSPSMLNAQEYTHLHFAFAYISNGQLAIHPEDVPKLQEFAQIKQRSPSTKLIISVGGWAFNDPPNQYLFSNTMRSVSSRSAFIDSVMSLLQSYNLDGLDMDWEYPTAPDRGGSPDDIDNYLALVSQLRARFGFTYSLSIAAPASFWYLKGFDIGNMASFLDYIVYMTYDLHGNWDWANKWVGPALNTHNNWKEVQQTVNLIQKAGVPSNKLLLGLGYYGRSFKLADPSCTQLLACKYQNPGRYDPSTQQYENAARPGACTQVGGILASFEIDRIIKDQNLTLVLNNGQDFVGYDDAFTIGIKTQKAREMCFKGVAFWAADMSPEYQILDPPTPTTSTSPVPTDDPEFSNDEEEGTANMPSCDVPSKKRTLQNSPTCPYTRGSGDLQQAFQYGSLAGAHAINIANAQMAALIAQCEQAIPPNLLFGIGSLSNSSSESIRHWHRSISYRRIHQRRYCYLAECC
ncbi:glycoside hydrolase superfamily [Gorgonomyces haynaldii]|nr:glycoside hydrolase superfamily [Gorgonomyces haynaldii]